MATADRPVRLIIDGIGHPVLDSHGAPTKAMRVSYDTGQGTHGTVLVLTDSPDVLLAEVERPREWTDGDVVLIGAGVWVRQSEARWVCGDSYGGAYGYDSDMEQALAEGRATVLRYQAGGDA